MWLYLTTDLVLSRGVLGSSVILSLSSGFGFLLLTVGWARRKTLVVSGSGPFAAALARSTWLNFSAYATCRA